MKANLFVFIILFTISYNAQAGYYLVYTAPMTGCCYVMTDEYYSDPCYHHHHYKHAKPTKHRVHHQTTYTNYGTMMPEYAWVP